jgi:hypothetical protein
MKFIPIEKARGLEIDQPVFTIDANGNYGYGKLIKEEKTAKGIERTFEMSAFYPDPNSTAPLYPYRQTNITHVCIPK